MMFDPTKLPEREWLKLSEVVNFLALGEALNATDQVPADRTYLAEIGAALERCRSQARDGTRSAERSDFLEMVGSNDSYAPFPPTSAQLERFKTAWPPYSQRLYDLVVEWERAHEQEIKRRAEAEQEVLQWLLSGEVEFEGMIVDGDRRGCRERIDVDHILDPVAFWGHDRIAAHPRDGHYPRPGEPRRMLVWDDVQIKRSSLVKWFRPPDPDPAKFDPMQEPYWTLPMAVAWIRSESPDAVREQWDAWLEKCLERRSHEDGYYYMEPRRKASLAELIATSPENQEAWEILRQALQTGEATATAFHTANGERVCVPDSAWAVSENQTTGHPNTVPAIRQPCAPLPDESVYADILLKRSDVQQLQSTAAESTTPPREKKRRGRTPRYTPECEAAARRIVAEKKASTKPSDKTDTAVILAFQEWWEIEYPNEPVPVRQTVRDWLTLWGL